jgi:hypothetical protein
VEQRRRRLPRENIGWPGRYRFDGDPDDRWGDCQVIDVSLLGAGVLLFGTLPSRLVGRTLTVEVVTPAGASITIRIAGETRNVTPGPDGGTRIGIEFTDISETERSILDVMGHMKIVW